MLPFGLQCHSEAYDYDMIYSKKLAHALETWVEYI